jgi:hypothetical protein
VLCRPKCNGEKTEIQLGLKMPLGELGSKERRLVVPWLAVVKRSRTDKASGSYAVGIKA